MNKTNVEVLFEQINHLTEMLDQSLNETYLDSLGFALELLFEPQKVSNYDETLQVKLDSIIKEINLTTYDKEQIRQAIQFAVLKGMKNFTQQQHLITPETVALFIAYLAEKVTSKLENVRLFDPVSGTGGLLLTVADRLKQTKEIFASEVDPTLIKLSAAIANIQHQEIQFFHQDSLQPLLMDPADLVVADLPVGYYPDDIRANDFELKADEGHSYSHHLLIEQSLNYTKEGGYLIFVIPEFLFNSDQADKLYAFFEKEAHIVGVLQLPETAFKSEKNRKSILLLQKKGKSTQNPKQPLLAKIPSLHNKSGIKDILQQMDEWFEGYFNN